MSSSPIVPPPAPPSTPPTGSAEPDDRIVGLRPSGWLLIAAFALVLGLMIRTIPLTSGEARMLQQWPTEDGYLMLTIARNIAIGNGMTVAEGSIPTNGTQPLMTFLYAAGFAVTGGDKSAGVLVALVMQLIIAAAGFVLLHHLIARVVRPHRLAPAAATVGASLWFLGPLITSHSMNCLETGLSMLLIMTAALAWLRLLEVRETEPGLHAGRAAVLGVALGLATLARIDAALLVTAVTGVHFLAGALQRPARTRPAFLESCIAGAIAVMITAPWLIANQVRFGSIMPISGTAQQASGSFASNLAGLPAVLTEHIVLAGGIPSSMQTSTLVQIGGAAVALVFFGLTALLAFRSRSSSRILVAGSLLAVLIYAGYYGLTFGAPHFLSRYMLPVAILAAGVTGLMGAWILQILHARGPAGRGAIAALLLIGVGAIGFQHLRIHRNAMPHMHWQVVEWIDGNVPDETWVGAIQTGTLGFFHDRTINLDGKVNPEALEARLERRIPEYVAGSQIMYLADWVGIAGWTEHEPIAENFDVIVQDPERNLAVLERRAIARPPSGAPPHDATTSTLD